MTKQFLRLAYLVPMNWWEGFTAFAGLLAVGFIGHQRGLRRIEKRKEKSPPPPPKIFDEQDDV